MNPLHDSKTRTTCRTFLGTIRGAFSPAIAAFLLNILILDLARADREADFKKLGADFEAASKTFYDTHKLTKSSPAAERIAADKAWPGWEYLPRFLALAEADPADDASYRACWWLLDRPSFDKDSFAAQQKAWRIIAINHSQDSEVPKLCLKTVQTCGPAEEEYLRNILKQPNLSRENAAFATLALAELLAHRVNMIENREASPTPPPADEFEKYYRDRIAPEWKNVYEPTNAVKFKTESIQLFRTVLDKYADVPLTISMPYFRDIKYLREKAEKSLHALEHLSIGAEAPPISGHDLAGNSLQLSDYRGRVVLLSFWFTGCGPCMAMIPEEQKLVETFKDKPFALLAVSSDPEIELSRDTAQKQGITWPTWFDGENGPINRNYNIMSWPTLYLLDKQGRIVAKNVDRDHMTEEIVKLLDKKN